MANYSLLKKIPHIFKENLWKQSSKKYFESGVIESVFYYDNIKLKLINKYEKLGNISLHIEVESLKIKSSNIKYYDEVFILESRYKKDILYQINQDLLNLDNRIIKMLPIFLKSLVKIIL